MTDSSGVRVLGIAGALSLYMLLASNVPAGAASTTYTYDSAGRLVTTKAADGTTTQYNLDAAGNRVTVVTTKDTTAPGVPTGLSATASSSTQVALTWTASSDSGAGVGGYFIYRGGSQIGSSATPSYTDSTTTCNTAYSYTVSAFDNANPPNVSAQSSAAAVTTPVTSPPSVPTGLTKVSATSAQVVLSWTASSDSCTSVAGYRIYRGGVQIGTSTTLSYTDSTTGGTTAYSYTVAAYDSFGNVSGQSSALAVTTPDTIAPTVPTGLTGSAPSQSLVNLNWVASTDSGGSGLAGYRVYRGGAALGTASSASYSDTTTTCNTAYSYTVAAYDNAGNTSAQSSAFSITTPVSTPPSVPTGLAKTSATSTQVGLAWNASSDSCTTVAGYRIYRGGTQIGTSAGTTYTDSTTSGTTTYSYTVAAYDSFGNVSAQSTALSVTTPDTIPPSVPTGLSAGTVLVTTASFSWTASSDSGGSGLAGYSVYRNGSVIATTAATSYSDSGLAAGGTYSYTVSAHDNAGNTSAQSSALNITTLAAYPITDANGNIVATAASLYSTAKVCSTLLESCQLTVTTTYGTPKTVYSFRDHNTANPCPDDSGAVFGVTATAGYSQPSNTSCIIVATPSVYGN